MIDVRNSDTRRLLLEAAAELIAGNPGKDVPLRVICDRVGVKMPTLYHFFGNKEGLLNAVIEHGFDLYVDLKKATESTGDPIHDIRDGWDAHTAFGLANPGFYALMYGQVAPGSRPAAQQRPTLALLKITKQAEREGLLAVSAQQAAAHILAANIGVTLRQITDDSPDPDLSTAVREATIAAITGIASSSAASDRAGAAAILLASLSDGPDILIDPETVLLRHWLTLLARSQK